MNMVIHKEMLIRGFANKLTIESQLITYGKCPFHLLPLLSKASIEYPNSPICNKASMELIFESKRNVTMDDSKHLEADSNQR